MKPSKSAIYKDEQKQIRNTLIDILKLHNSPLNVDVKTITLQELDKTEKQKAILDLLPTIKEYFAIKNRALVYPNETKRPHLEIIKLLLKEYYQIVGKYVNEHGIKTTGYFFYPIVS